MIFFFKKQICVKLHIQMAIIFNFINDLNLLKDVIIKHRIDSLFLLKAFYRTFTFNQFKFWLSYF